MLVIVMGVPGAGKSTFIKEKFSDYKKVDIWDFQDFAFPTQENLYKAFIDCKDTLLDAIQTNENVVLEHTLFRAIRRKFYLEEIRKVYNGPIDLYFITPDDETINKNNLSRGSFSTISNVQAYKAALETPLKEEGFDNVYVINNFEVSKDNIKNV